MWLGAKLTRGGLVMRDFICQFDWAMKRSDIWLNIILGMSVRVFLHAINIWIVDWVKQSALP